MVRKPGRSWRVAAALCGLSVGLLAMAAQVSPPNATTSSEEPVAIVLDSAVLDRYVGDYQLAPSAVLTATRDGAHLGAVQSVEFRGGGNQGWYIFDVRQEHGSSQWRIALGAGGTITGALVAAGP